MTLAECEMQLKVSLHKLYDAGEATAITDRILEEYTGSNRQQRWMNGTHTIPAKALQEIQAATHKLLLGTPLQYVLGYADFYGIRFQVNDSVLIPRPETEELVDWMIKEYRQWGGLHILDIGTGSGCIPITLKKNLPAAVIASLDISEPALKTATQNAAMNKTSVSFMLFDFLENVTWQQLGKYHVMVSNPPYIPRHEEVTMASNVSAWEPATALFVPDGTPLLFYEKIALFGKTHLEECGCIYLETHKDYAIAVQELFTQQGYATELKKDMHGNDRMVKALLTNS